MDLHTVVLFGGGGLEQLPFAYTVRQRLAKQKFDPEELLTLFSRSPRISE